MVWLQMDANQTGPAKLYRTRRTDTPFVVVFRDPTQREKSGRAKRVVKWFADEAKAVKHRDQLNEDLLAEGAAGVNFDAHLRGDALAARRHLDAKGHEDVALLTLAQRYTATVTTNAAAALPIGPQVDEFLHDKVHVDGSERETTKNLETRLWMWIELAKILTVGDITRATVEPLRTRTVSAQTRKNDMNAVSNFCTWLVDKRRLDYHPLKGLKRPKVKRARPPVHTPDEVRAMLENAARYRRGKWLGSVAALYFTGARPSELKETRFTYGRHPEARIEGGKLDGRANRTVPLLPAAVAWLTKAGKPEQVRPLKRTVRNRLCRDAGVKWRPDIPRHTFITCRLKLVDSDSTVAREAGTSEEIIHRHYRNPKVTKPEARAWAALRPKRR